MLNQTQQANARAIADSCAEFGITNAFLVTGIVACDYKECGLIPQRENMNYHAETILKDWPGRVTPELAAQLAGNPVAMGNFLYGNRYGNGPGDGYKYRGGGYDQLTFKDNYITVGKKIGVDLENNPDLIDDPVVAAKATVVHFLPEITAGLDAGSFKQFGINTMDDIGDIDGGLKVILCINAGRATSWNNPLVQQGYVRANTVLQEIWDLLNPSI